MRSLRDTIVNKAHIKKLLRDEKIRYGSIRNNQAGIEAKFKTQKQRDAGLKIVKKALTEMTFLTVDSQNNFGFTAQFSEVKQKEIFDYTVNQNIDTLRNRVNELGVAEPLVQRHGKSRIVVQLPGVQRHRASKRHHR